MPRTLKNKTSSLASPVNLGDRPKPVGKRRVSESVVKTRTSKPRSPSPRIRFSSVPAISQCIDLTQGEPSEPRRRSPRVQVEEDCEMLDSPDGNPFRATTRDVPFRPNEEDLDVDIRESIERYEPIDRDEVPTTPENTHSRKTSSSSPPKTPQRDGRQSTIDDGIRKCLRKLPVKPGQNGLVYIKEVIGEENLFKVGFTDRTAEERSKEITHKCGFNLDVQYRSSKRIPLFKQAEKLVHAELHAFRHYFKCPGCGSTHREYFRLPLQDIEPVVLRWERFLAQKPYDTGSGLLTDFWQQKLDDHPAISGDGNRNQQPQLNSRWDSFVDTTTVDKHIFNVASFITWLGSAESRSFEFWRKPMVCLWAFSLLFYFFEGGLRSEHLGFRLFLEALQAVFLVSVTSTLQEEKNRSSRSRSVR